jgi:hypothetical protein
MTLATSPREATIINATRLATEPLTWKAIVQLGLAAIAFAILAHGDEP